jgi:hypothetical protein
MDTAPRPAGYLCWAVSRTRLRSSGSPARPNICLLIILMWLDPAFDRAGVPAAGQALGDGVEILLEAFGERRHAWKLGGPDVADPLREVLAGELGEHRGERADVAGGGLEFGAAFQQGLQLGPLVFGQGVGMAGEPTGDLADSRRSRRERRLGGAVLLKVVTDGGVAAGVAE